MHMLHVHTTCTISKLPHTVTGTYICTCTYAWPQPGKYIYLYKVNSSTVAIYSEYIDSHYTYVAYAATA